MKSYGPQLFVCPLCGLEDYRTRQWAPVEKPLFKGDEAPLQVTCNAPIGDLFCGGAMEQDFSGIAMDLLPNSFEVDRQTLGLEGEGTVKISSLKELRNIERESIIKHEGDPTKHAPLIFRTMSQDNSNRHDNVFTGTSYERARSQRVPKRRTVSDQPISIRAIPDPT